MEIKRRLSSIEKIIAMGEKLLTTFDVSELLDALVESVTSLLDAEGATLYLIDSAEQKLFSQSIHSDGVKEIVLPVDNTSIAGYTATSCECLNIRDVYEDLSGIHPSLKFNRHYDEIAGKRTRSVITHPLVMNGGIIGVFQVLNKRNGLFDADDQAMLKNFSIVAAIAIMNARLMEKIMETQSGYLNVIENISDLVVIMNREGRILQINHSAGEYLRSSKRSIDVCGSLFTDVFHELGNFAGEVARVVDGNLDRSVSRGNPSFVILTEKNFQKSVEKVILIIRNIELLTA
jgi:PAS domain-containing protein